MVGLTTNLKPAKDISTNRKPVPKLAPVKKKALGSMMRSQSLVKHKIMSGLPEFNSEYTPIGNRSDSQETCIPQTMCGGITYTYPNPETGQKETRRVYFPQPHAQVPVIDDGGAIHLCQWGRRNEQEDSEYDVPVTGWARSTKLDSGYWKRYNPDQVLIPAMRFSEKGKLPKSRWFDMPQDTYIMGLKILQRDKGFIYVVTNPAIGELEKIHPRMPLVVNADFSPADFDIEAEPQAEQQTLF